MSTSARRRQRKAKSKVHSGEVVLPETSSAPEPPMDSHASQLPAATPIDFTQPRFPEAYLATRVSAPGLKRVIAIPEELEPYAFEWHSDQRSFWFLDHPCIANIIPYLRRSDHVEAQKPEVLSELFESTFEVLVSDFQDLCPRSRP
jgi:hypothetical protein